MKKIPKHPEWHYLKILGIALLSIIFFAVVTNLDKTFSIISFFTGIFTPILIGIAMAFIFNLPLKFYEERAFGKLTQKNGPVWRKIKRPICLVLSVISILSVITVLLYFVIPKFWDKCRAFFEMAPSYVDFISGSIKEFIINFNIPVDPESINFTWSDVTSWVLGLIKDNDHSIIQGAYTTAMSVINGTWNFILGFIFAIYILLSKDYIKLICKKAIFSIFSIEKAERILYVSSLSDKAFSGFITGQCIEVMLIGTLCFIGMSIFRFPHALMVSCIIAITAFIPIFGAIIGAGIGAFLILLVDPVKAIWFLIFIIILQQVESNLIYPKIMGTQVGLPSLWVLAAITVGGGLFGIVGFLISVPLCSVLYTLFLEWTERRLKEKNIVLEPSTAESAEPPTKGKKKERTTRPKIKIKKKDKK